MSFSLPSIAFVKLPSVPGDQILEDMEAGRSGRKRQKADPHPGFPRTFATDGVQAFLRNDEPSMALSSC